RFQGLQGGANTALDQAEGDGTEGDKQCGGQCQHHQGHQQGAGQGIVAIIQYCPQNLRQTGLVDLQLAGEGQRDFPLPTRCRFAGQRLLHGQQIAEVNDLRQVVDGGRRRGVPDSPEPLLEGQGIAPDRRRDGGIPPLQGGVVDSDAQLLVGPAKFCQL